MPDRLGHGAISSMPDAVIDLIVNFLKYRLPSSAAEFQGGRKSVRRGVYYQFAPVTQEICKRRRSME